jgi:hypothetical protein
LQPDGLDREEVDSQEALPMGSDELAPRHLSAVTRRSQTRGSEPGAHRRRRYRDAKAFQFADDPWIAPARVLAREPQHQLSRLTSDRRPTDRTRVRPPLRNQTSMPAQQGRRCDEEGSPLRARQQSTRRGQEHAVNGRGRRSALRTPKNGEFVPKNNDFEVLELTRPRAKRHEFEQPPQQHVAERHEHANPPALAR